MSTTPSPPWPVSPAMTVWPVRTKVVGFVRTVREKKVVGFVRTVREKRVVGFVRTVREKNILVL